MSLHTLKRCFVRLFQEMNVCLKRPSWPAIDDNIEIPNDDHGLPSSSSNYGGSSTTSLTAHVVPLLFPNTLYFALSSPSIYSKSVPHTSPTSSNSLALSLDSNATFIRLLKFCCSNIQVQKTVPAPFSRAMDY